MIEPSNKFEMPPPIYKDVDKVPLTLLDQLSGHWRTMVEQKKKQHDVNTKQIIIGQLFTIVAVAAFGVAVEENKEALLLVGSTLIIYPSLVDLMVSNSSVLSASLHHDIDHENRNHLAFIVLSTLRSVVIAVFACALIGLLAAGLGYWIFRADVFLTLKLAVLTGSITAGIGLPFITLITFLARRLKSNPDDVAPPIENTVFNVLVLVALGIASRWLT